MKHNKNVIAFVLVAIAMFFTLACSAIDLLNKFLENQQNDMHEEDLRRMGLTLTAQAAMTEVEELIEKVYPATPTPTRTPSPTPPQPPEKPQPRNFQPPLPGLPKIIPGYEPPRITQQWWGEKKVTAYLAIYKKAPSNGAAPSNPVAAISHSLPQNAPASQALELEETLQINFLYFHEGDMPLTPTTDTSPVELPVSIGEKSAASRMEANGLQKVEVEFIKNFCHLSIIIKGRAGEDLLGLATRVAQEAEKSIPAEGEVTVPLPRWEGDQLLWTDGAAPAGTPSLAGFPAYLKDKDVSEWEFQPVFGLLQNEIFSPAEFSSIGKEYLYIDLRSAPDAPFALGFFDVDSGQYVSVVYGLQGQSGIIRLLVGTALQLEIVDRVDVIYFLDEGMAVRQHPLQP